MAVILGSVGPLTDTTIRSVDRLRIVARNLQCDQRTPSPGGHRLDTVTGALQQYPPVLSQPGVSAAAGLMLDIRQLPWMSRLSTDYASDYARLSGFYAGNPRDAAAWRDAISRTQRHERARGPVADVLVAQQRRRGACPETIAASDRLRARETVAVVTGQQAGLFGGPLFTLLKALTAIRLAAQVRKDHGVDAVPIFWVDAEDHDWNEVRACHVFGAALEPVPVSLGETLAGTGGPVARIRLDDSIGTAIETLRAAMPPTEFTPALLDALGRAYRPGCGMADAFATWLESVLGPLGLVVFDASDPAAKPLAAPIFSHELAHPGLTVQLANEAGRQLKALGYHQQVAPADGSVALFTIGASREPIRAEGDGFIVAGLRESGAAVAERVRQRPDGFSPNVLLRPLVQDTLFPTVCYVAGPSELAYLGQLAGVYEAFGVPMPLIQPRASATLLDPNASRFLARQDVAFASLRPQDEAALNALLQAQLPTSIERALQEAVASVDARLGALAAEVRQLDPTLEAATASAQGRMQDDLKKLHGKIIQASKRKHDTLRRQFTHAQAQAFPGGHAQEREIGFISFLNRVGPALVERLHEELPIEPGVHWIATL